MGVMACDRNGCENIMCDRLSHKYGYLCNECFDELKTKLPSISIREFMESEKADLHKSWIGEAMAEEEFEYIR